MKTRLLVMIVAVCALMLTGCSQPPEDVQAAEISESQNAQESFEQSELEKVVINTETSTFEFEGYGPGKSHVGYINDFEGELLIENGQIVGAQGILDMNSIDTGIEGLDNHLKAEDFFDVENCPEGTFSSTSIEDGVMVGDLTIHCVTKSIQVPVNVTENMLEANFLLNTTPFGMENAFVNQDVRIAFTMIGE